MLILLFALSFIYSEIPQKKFAIIYDDITVNLGDNINILKKNKIKYLLKTKNVCNQLYDCYVFEHGTFLTIHKEKIIVGIEIDSPEISLLLPIKLNDKKDEILKALGKPDYTNDSIFYYYNEEFDLLELQLLFDNKEKLSKICMYLGT